MSLKEKSFQQFTKFRTGRINLPANTGRDNNNNTAVITTAHPNNASLCNLIPGVLILTIVVMTQNNVIIIIFIMKITLSMFNFVDYLFRKSKVRLGVKRIVSEDPTYNKICYFCFLLIKHQPIRFSLFKVLIDTKLFQHIVLILYKPHLFTVNVLLVLLKRSLIY